MRRTVQADLIPSYTEKSSGFHIIVDTNTSPIRKMLPKEVKVEEASLNELTKADPHTLMDYVQRRLSGNRPVVVFLSLDSKKAQEGFSEDPPKTTPATKLKDLIPPMLLEPVDSVAFVVDHSDMVLVIQHRWRPSDVYLFDTTKEKK